MTTEEKYSKMAQGLMDLVEREYDLRLLRKLDGLLQSTHAALSTKIAEHMQTSDMFTDAQDGPYPHLEQRPPETQRPPASQYPPPPHWPPDPPHAPDARVWSRPPSFPPDQRNPDESGRRSTDKHTHASGVTRSHKTPGYDQIPLEFLQCVAERFDLGLESKKDKAWQVDRDKTLTDKEFYAEALRHMFEHLSKLMNHDLSEDSAWGHIGAISWGAAVWAWWIKNWHRGVEAGPGKGMED